MAKTLHNFFRFNLVLLRTFHNLEVQDVAEKIRIKKDRYKAWERGDWYPNDPCLLIALCDLYRFKDIYSMFKTQLTEQDLHGYYNARLGEALR